MALEQLLRQPLNTCSWWASVAGLSAHGRRRIRASASRGSSVAGRANLEGDAHLYRVDGQCGPQAKPTRSRMIARLRA